MRSLEDIVRLSARWFSRIPEGSRAEALELAVEIARSHSPSSAFDRAVPLLYSRLPDVETFRFASGGGVVGLAFSKLARWLAVARRDYGEGGMEEVVRALEAML